MDEWWNEELEEREFTLLDEGIYAAKMHDCSCDVSKEPYSLSVQWKLIDGPNKGQLAFSNYNMKETSKKWLQWQLGILHVWSLGKEKNSLLAATQAMYEGLASLLEKKICVELEVEHTEYNGNTYANVKINKVLSEVQVQTEYKAESNPKNDVVDNPPEISFGEELGF